jgi:coenzyme F420-0:L-glutamate ligase/coenzyme F420-1:gamma-L-glutamate ligase
MTLVLTPLPGIPLVQPGDDLADLILQSLERCSLHLQDGDILVLAQKIVSKAEGRLVNLSNIIPSTQAMTLATQCEKDPRLVELILSESKEILRIRPGTIIVEHRLGFVCANAGIDHSNVSPAINTDEALPCAAEDWMLLLPVDPDASARSLRESLENKFGVRLGVLIIDSHGRAWRIGVVGTSIGLSGMPGLVDLRGNADLFGFHLRITQVGAADELAAAASLVMGQAAEGTPVVHVRGFPYPLTDGKLDEILRPKAQDMFR